MAVAKVQAGPVEDEDGFTFVNNAQRTKPVRQAAPANTWNEPSRLAKGPNNRFAGAAEREDEGWNRD